MKIEANPKTLFRIEMASSTYQIDASCVTFVNASLTLAIASSPGSHSPMRMVCCNEEQLKNLMLSCDVIEARLAYTKMLARNLLRGVFTFAGETNKLGDPECKDHVVIQVQPSVKQVAPPVEQVAPPVKQVALSVGQVAPPGTIAPEGKTALVLPSGNVAILPGCGYDEGVYQRALQTIRIMFGSKSILRTMANNGISLAWLPGGMKAILSKKLQKAIVEGIQHSLMRTEQNSKASMYAATVALRTPKGLDIGEPLVSMQIPINKPYMQLGDINMNDSEWGWPRVQNGTENKIEYTVGHLVALAAAIRGSSRYSDVFTKLIECGVDFTQKASNGMTPVDMLNHASGIVKQKEDSDRYKKVRRGLSDALDTTRVFFEPAKHVQDHIETSEEESDEDS